MIKCPHCGASHYSEGPSMRTAMYYPPIWKEGINVNPDRNTTTTTAHCYECNYDFIIKECGEEVWTEEGKYNPPQPPIDINITAIPNTYVPIETQTNTATINIRTNEPIRTKFQWEIDIEEIKKEIAELKKQIAELAGEVYALN